MELGAGGVVFNKKGKVLLLRHRNGDWVFPKGHVEKGETLLETAIREIEEESGVNAYADEDSFKLDTSYINSAGALRQISWFLLKTKDKKPILREETFPEGKFFSVEKALTKLSYRQDVHLLEQMQKHYS